MSGEGYLLADQETHEVSIVDLIPALRAFARTFCRIPDDADDLVQETLTKGLANIDKFEPGTRMKSWLFTIMRNTYYTRVKVAARKRLACSTARPRGRFRKPHRNGPFRARKFTAPSRGSLNTSARC